MQQTASHSAIKKFLPLLFICFMCTACTAHSPQELSPLPDNIDQLSLEKRIEILEQRYAQMYQMIKGTNAAIPKLPHTDTPAMNNQTSPDIKASERPLNLQSLQNDMPVLPEPILDIPTRAVTNEALDIRFGKHPDKHRIVVDFAPESMPEFDFITSPNMISVTLKDTLWRGQTVGFPDINDLWVEHYNVEQQDTKVVLNLGVSTGVYVHKIFGVPAKEPEQNVRLVIDVTK